MIDPRLVGPYSVQELEGMNEFKEAGRVAKLLGDYRRAIDNFVRAGYPFIAATTAEAIGLMDEAKRYYWQAFETYEPMGFYDVAAKSLQKLGLEVRAQEMWEKELLKSRALLPRHSWAAQDVVTALENLGRTEEAKALCAEQVKRCLGEEAPLSSRVWMAAYWAKRAGMGWRASWYGFLRAVLP